MDIKKKAVAWWLIAGVIMIIIQTLLGGVTRLTGSGLSITEWKPLLGTVPPLNESQWNKAFDGYKQIAQYKYLNSHFTLSEFKHIYFWEWMHRQWARLLAVVFGLGFAYFLARKYFDRKMILPLIILVALGAAQGLIGWIMVASGLNDTNLYVDHFKLAMHFIGAMILACYTLWFALQLLIPQQKRAADSRLHSYTLLIIILLSIQLVYGAFMAGLKAATFASTWPDINGSFIPETFTKSSYFSEPLNVHFIHRMLAYTLLVAIIGWSIAARRSSKLHPASVLPSFQWWPLALVAIQVTLGILTVLSAQAIQPGKFGTFELLAEWHQLIAMFLLMALIVNLYIAGGKRFNR